MLHRYHAYLCVMQALHRCSCGTLVNPDIPCIPRSVCAIGATRVSTAGVHTPVAAVNYPVTPPGVQYGH